MPLTPEANREVDRVVSLLDPRMRILFVTGAIVFAVGTTGHFSYILGPVMLAHVTRVPTVEINPGATEFAVLSSIKIKAGAAEALDAIWSRYRQKHGLV